MGDAGRAEDDGRQSLSEDKPPHDDEKAVPSENEEHDDELRRLLLPDDVSSLPLSPPSVIETNFVRYYAPGLSLSLSLSLSLCVLLLRNVSKMVHWNFTCII